MLVSLQNRTAFGFSLALVLVIVVGYVSYRNSQEFIETNRLVAHTHEVLQNLEVLLANVVDAESGQRGFVITNDEAFIAPFIAAEDATNRSLNALRFLTADNPAQQERLGALETEISARFTTLQHVLDAYDIGGFNAARALIESGAGQESMNTIRQIISDMRDEENTLLERRVAAAEVSARVTLVTFVMLTGLVAMLLAFVMILINRDFSRRNALEHALAQERNLLRTVIDVVPDLIYLKDRQGRFLLANKAHARLVGALSPEAMVGKSDADFFPADLAVGYRRDEAALIASGETLIDHEEPSVNHDGKPVIHSSTKLVLRDANGAPDRIVGITHDITERRQAVAEIEALNQSLHQQTEQLEAANQELEAFSYSISHDLRAPLRAMSGFSRIMVDDYADLLPDDAKRYLRLISKNAGQMGELIDDLLAFSRLSRQPITKQPILPAEIARLVLDDFQEQLANREIAVTIGDLPPAYADPVLVRQVYANLLGNAIKFTSRRESAVIDVGAQTLDGEMVYFVRDNGAGFEMQYAHKLFGVFQRLHRAEDFEGTGVGLAIVQRIVRRHGGRVWAESVVNEGTTFYFTLESTATSEPVTAG